MRQPVQVESEHVARELHLMWSLACLLSVTWSDHAKAQLQGAYMPIRFVPRECSSFDEESGVSILRPRMLPDSEPGLVMGVEYQYTFIRNGKDVGGLGFLGVSTVVDIEGRRREEFTLDLRGDLVIRSILRFRERIRNEDEPFDFLSGLAQGLLNCFAMQTGNALERHYLVYADVKMLARQQIQIPDDAVLDEQGRIVLAELTVPTGAS